MVVRDLYPHLEVDQYSARFGQVVAHTQTANLRHGHASAKAGQQQCCVMVPVLRAAHFGHLHRMLKLLIFDNDCLGHGSL